MIEIYSNRFNAIVAAPAVCSISQGVSRHKDFVHLLVTGCASQRVKVGDIVAVTVGAGELLTIAEPPVRVERIARLLMRKIAGLHIRQASVRTVVIGMAGAASDELVFQHHAVQSGRVGQLGGNLRMADLATVAKGLGIPGGGVALGTVVTDFGM
jgi:hypothetical protein